MCIRDRPVIEHVYMLAAAVTVASCAPEGLYGAQFGGTQYHVLYSPRDPVLRLAFPPGQAWAHARIADQPSESGVPEAVGRFGLPREQRWHRRVNTRLLHGGYWKSSMTAYHVGRVLGGLPERHLPSEDASAPDEEPAALSPAERTIPSQQVLG